MGQFAQRVEKGQAAKIEPILAANDDALRGMPALVEYLTLSEWEDGKPRKTATLSVSFEDGRFRASIRDRANRRIAWVSAASFTGILAALESGLQDETLEWRTDKFSK